MLLYSCKERQETSIIINGNVKNIPSKKVYLTNAYSWDIFLDSAKYENDRFEFVTDTSKYPEPFLASICILNGKNKIEQLAVFNYKRTNAKDTFGNTGFMLSFGKTELSGDYNDKYHRVSIKPNKENDLYFDLKTEYFGSRKNIKFIKATIQDNPSSFFLLQQLFQYKRLYSANELMDILPLFDKRIQNCNTMIELKQYCSYLPEKGAAYPNAQLTNLKGDNVLLFTDSAKINMLIFWASWCGPCRQEIPQLKTIRNMFPEQVLSMKSISIDEDAKKWEKALNEETMPWEQFLIPYKDLLKIKAQFSVNAVPTIIFTDKNMKLIKRFEGYSETNIAEYTNSINEYLNKKE
jgi:thiol-disulfide isomerase/thioredoxin